MGFKIWLGVLLAAQSSPALSASSVGPNWVAGTVADVSALGSGLLITMDDDAQPTNCAGSIAGWMQIAQADTVMVSTFLTYWAAGKSAFQIYTYATPAGFCSVEQVDPAD